MNRDDRELKRITPFSVRVDVAFTPDRHFAGYNVSASGIAEIGDNRLIVSACPQLAFTSAKWFYSLSFGVNVEASAIVPLVNMANKD